MLNAKSEPIMKIVQDVLRIVLKLHAQLSSVEWSVDGEGRVTHPAFAAVMKTHRQFSGYSRFLFKGGFLKFLFCVSCSHLDSV